MPSDSPDQGEVSRCIGQLEDHLASTEELVDSLTNRISTLLMPETSDEISNSTQEAKTPLGKRLEESDVRITRLNCSLSQLNERVSL